MNLYRFALDWFQAQNHHTQGRIHATSDTGVPVSFDVHLKPRFGNSDKTEQVWHGTVHLGEDGRPADLTLTKVSENGDELPPQNHHVAVNGHA